MRRRDLATSALFGLGAAALAAVPKGAAAAAAGGEENVLFSNDDPGHWGPGMAALHTPQLTLAGGVLTIKTPHPQSQAHYIVSHTVVLAGGVYLSRKTFAYTDEPVSQHTLPAGYAGPVTVTSTCNLHDIWTNAITA